MTPLIKWYEPQPPDTNKPCARANHSRRSLCSALNSGCRVCGPSTPIFCKRIRSNGLESDKGDATITLALQSRDISITCHAASLLSAAYHGLPSPKNFSNAVAASATTPSLTSARVICMGVILSQHKPASANNSNSEMLNPSPASLTLIFRT